jgi:hypothetical protein
MSEYYEDDGSGYEDAGGYDAPEMEGEHWSADPQWLNFAEAVVGAMQRDPTLIDRFSQAVDQHYAPGPAPKLTSRELKQKAEDFLRRGRENP